MRIDIDRHLVNDLEDPDSGGSREHLNYSL
jgi:hypothetical protein